MTQDPNSTTILEQTISQLFEATASTQPTPGGGCVSAVGGYLGIALLLKAIRISARKQTGENTYEIEERKLSVLAERLASLAQADSNSFGLFITALQMPKSTEDEKESRRHSMAMATIEATTVSIEILRASNGILRSAAAIRAKVLKSIIADVRAGVEFAATMAVVARENATANLANLPAGPERENFERAISRELHANEVLLRDCRSQAQESRAQTVESRQIGSLTGR